MKGLDNIQRTRCVKVSRQSTNREERGESKRGHEGGAEEKRQGRESNKQGGNKDRGR